VTQPSVCAIQYHSDGTQCWVADQGGYVIGFNTVDAVNQLMALRDSGFQGTRLVPWEDVAFNLKRPEPFPHGRGFHLEER
jgi:hypothetical protein